MTRVGVVIPSRKLTGFPHCKDNIGCHYVLMGCQYYAESVVTFSIE